MTADRVYGRAVPTKTDSMMSHLSNARISQVNGTIYLMAHSEAFKVGFSQDPSQRLRHTQTHIPQKLSLVATFPGTFADEQSFHKRFKKQSLGNEWYPLSFQAEALEYLRTLDPKLFTVGISDDSTGSKKRKNVHPRSLANLQHGRSKYGCPTQSIRVPIELIPQVRALVDEFVKAQSPSEQAILDDPIDLLPNIQ